MKIKVFLSLLAIGRGQYSGTQPNGLEIQWEVQNDRLSFHLITSHEGYVSVGLAPGSSMANAEIVVLSKDGNNFALYEYEGKPFNSKPDEKTDPGSWRIDSQSGGDIRISRAVSPNSCSICKSVSDPHYVLWATGNAFNSPNAIGYHSARGNLGSHVLQGSSTPAPSGGDDHAGHNHDHDGDSSCPSVFLAHVCIAVSLFAMLF